MSTFHVYTHPQSGYEAIPEGFSVPAAGLGGVWALKHRLWRLGCVLLGADFAALFVIQAGRHAEAASWVAGAVLVAFVVHLFAGIRGSYWREDSMGRRGYVFLASAAADSTDSAVLRAMREERMGSDSGSSASDAAVRAAGAGIALGQSKPGTRSEIDFERLRGIDAGARGADSMGDSDEAATRALADPAATAQGSAPVDRQGDERDDAIMVRRRRIALAAGAAVLAMAATAGVVAWRTGGPATSLQAPQATAATMAPAMKAPVAKVQDTPEQHVHLPVEVRGPADPVVAASAVAAPDVINGAAAASEHAPVETAVQSPSPATTQHADVAASPAAPDKVRQLTPAEVESAWARYYKPPPKCVVPADWDTYVDCVNKTLRAREAFEEKWASALPPGTQRVSQVQ